MSSNNTSDVDDNEVNNNVSLLKYCNSPRCKTCLWKQLDQSCIVTNHLTNQTFDVNIEGSCRSKNFVYLLSCSHEKCNMQYVGYSSKAINERLSGHRNNLCSLKGHPPTHVGEHFKKLHSPSNLRIKPLQFLKEGDNFKKIEDSWMIKLSTVFPYGLNERVDTMKVKQAEIDILSNKTCIYELFDVKPSQRTKRGTGRSLNNEDVEDFSLKTFVDENSKQENFPRNLRCHINNLKLENKKMLFLHSIDTLQNKENLAPFQVHLFFAIKDLCYHNISKNFLPKQRNNSSNFLVLEFVNKLVEKVNISKILKNEDIKSKLPVADSLRIPNISMKFTKSIRSSITNYKETVLSNIKHNELDCDCENSTYKDRHHHHIITGNLEVLNNIELQNLLGKGLNYREQQPLNKSKALKAFSQSLDSYITNINSKLKKPQDFFFDWKNVIMDKIKTKLRKMASGKFNNVLNKKKVQQDLEILKQKFVFVPVDKASNNVAIICKKYYLQSLSNELHNTLTFRLDNSSEEEVIANHQSVIEKEFHIKIGNDNKSLPFLYWLPKFHKKVVGFRYITAGTNCSTKSLSICVGKGLQRCMGTVRQQSNYNNYFKEMNDYFVIDKTATVSEFLLTNNFLNSRKKVSSYDFETLYTHIPHHQLKSNVKKIVEKAFDSSKKRFICINNKTAFFSDKNHNNVICLSCSELVAGLSYLIDNSFVNYKGSIYRQVIGIPMGTNSAPHLANCYLAVYEYEYMQLLQSKNKLEELKNLQNIFRFQDDLLVLNDNGTFDTLYQHIYPKEMVLKKTNVSPQKVNFLDMSISVFQGKFRFSCYDKRNDFNFNVINFPFMCGNLPLIQMHGLFISQLVRYSHINSHFNDFSKCCNMLYKKLLKQGFNAQRLQKNFDRFCQQHMNVWCKFGRDLFSYKNIICSNS